MRSYSWFLELVLILMHDTDFKILLFDGHYVDIHNFNNSRIHCSIFYSTVLCKRKKGKMFKEELDYW